MLSAGEIYCGGDFHKVYDDEGACKVQSKMWYQCVCGTPSTFVDSTKAKEIRRAFVQMQYCVSCSKHLPYICDINHALGTLW